MAKKDYKYQIDGDKWYDWKGVKRPERQPHLTEKELEEALADNLKNHKHNWSQRGNEIMCDIGNSVHGKRISPNLRLAGTDDNGMPLLVPMRAIMRDEV